MGKEADAMEMKAMKAEAERQREEDRLEKIQQQEELERARAAEREKVKKASASAEEAKAVKRAEIERKVAAAREAQKAGGLKKTKTKVTKTKLPDPNKDGMIIEEIIEEEVDVGADSAEDITKRKHKNRKGKNVKNMAGFLL